MKRETQLRLNQINRAFYRKAADEFDATRLQAWAGWGRLPQVIDLPISSIVDIGCGNGRFGVFWAGQQAESFDYCGLDNNHRLLAIARERLSAFSHLTASLCQRDLVQDQMPSLRGQMIVIFGVLHHLPGLQQRRALLARTAADLPHDGYLIFAAWRFFEQDRFRRRIVSWPADIVVERNDYLLDWRRGERALRYCHYIDDEEHASLVKATGLSVVDDYRADGATGLLNRYTVLRKI